MSRPNNKKTANGLLATVFMTDYSLSHPSEQAQDMHQYSYRKIFHLLSFKISSKVQKNESQNRGKETQEAITVSSI